MNKSQSTRHAEFGSTLNNCNRNWLFPHAVAPKVTSVYIFLLCKVHGWKLAQLQAPFMHTVLLSWHPSPHSLGSPRLGRGCCVPHGVCVWQPQPLHQWLHRGTEWTKPGDPTPQVSGLEVAPLSGFVQWLGGFFPIRDNVSALLRALWAGWGSQHRSHEGWYNFDFLALLQPEQEHGNLLHIANDCWTEAVLLAWS